jgi:hypothetical protein
MVFYVWESIIGIVSLVPSNPPPPSPAPLAPEKARGKRASKSWLRIRIHYLRIRILRLKMPPFVKKYVKSSLIFGKNVNNTVKRLVYFPKNNI